MCLCRIFFSGLAQGLQTQPSSFANAEVWGKALVLALAHLYIYTRARPPSRTLVDPLAAFIDVFQEKSFTSFGEAVKAAGVAAEETKNIEAKAGRSAYVESERLIADQVPDAGAWGIKTILESLQV